MSHGEGQASAVSKPKPFQFVEGRPTTFRQSQDPEQENKDARDTPMSQKEAAASQSSPRKPWPSTPATRLPLADLIGNADEKYKGYDLVEISPQDQIIWQPARSPHSSYPRKTPTSRKRARSSSPPSSAQRKVSRHFKTSIGPSRRDDAKPSTHTPQIDPATALWNRYTTNSAVGKSLALSAFPLAMSSPQSGKVQASTVGGLRRWTSCGVEWPTSIAKRRKARNSTIQEEIEGVFTDIPPSGDEEAARELKRSRIGSIIQRIQNTLNKPDVDGELEMPSSTSPLPGRGEPLEQDQPSPSRAPVEARAETDITEQRNPGQTLSDSSQTLSKGGLESQSSAFGSDDIDFDILEIVDNSTMTGHTSYANDTPALAHAGVNTVSGCLAPGLETSQTIGFGDEDDDDEFGDDAGLSLADFETVASKYEGHPEQTTRGMAADALGEPATFAANMDDFADEFGDDDIDEASFAALEAAATQSHTSNSRSYPSVSSPL